VARPVLFESAGCWAVTSRRTLASEAIVRPSGPRPSFGDGWDLAMCLGLEKGHLRYLRDLRVLCDGSFVMPSCLCVLVFAMCAAPCLLCASVSLWFNPIGMGGKFEIRNSKFEIALSPRLAPPKTPRYTACRKSKTKGVDLMGKGLIGCGLVALLVVGVVVMMAMGVYNNLVGLEEKVDEAWGQVENVYQRRADLIPNLVATVKGAADFEQETLQNVVEARAKVGQTNIEGAPTAAQMQAFQANQDALSSALSRLLVVVERYPELKAVQGFQDLQVQLEGTENRIAVERKRYNEVARDYNTARRRFPAVLFAGLMGFEENPYFESTPGAEVPPVVEF